MPFFLGMPEWLVLAVTVCVLCYLYASRHRNYWKNQDVVSEPYALIFGPPLKLFYKPIHEIDAERYDKYGRFFGAFESNKLLLFVAEPELVKQVLIKDFPYLPNRRAFTFHDPLLDNMISFASDEQWRKIRRTTSPAFSTGKLRKMNSLIEDCALVTTEHLKNAASIEEDIDVKQFFGHYTLDVIARCAFATRLDSHSDQTNEFVTKSTHAFSGRLTLRLFVFFAFPALSKLLRIRPFDSKIFLYFKQLCKNAIKSRRDKEFRHEDFLQLMMDAQEGALAYTAEDGAERDNQQFNLVSDLRPDASFSSNRTLTEDESLAQCVLFFIAGQNTTAAVISHTLYLLAIHPDVQKRLRDEVDECFKMHGDHPSLDVITNLKYMRCVVSESLRVYPAVMRIERSPYRDYVVGGTGVKVKKGDLIAIPIYSMHHDPEYFPDPSKFDPERFSDENVENIRPFTYLPFGDGPRNCIGMRFALQAVKLSILQIGRAHV